jgi:phosphoribosyl 1,2-cyclic phosphodiesterase
VSVQAGEHTVIFDAGSGIRACGNRLLARRTPVEAVILITHTHWDHIQGFPFFVPSYIPGNSFTVCGPTSEVGGQTIRQTMELQTKYEHFPVRVSQLGARIEYVECGEGRIDVNGLTIDACRVNHPVICLAYKLVFEGKVFVYGGDHEPYRNLYRDTTGRAEMDEELLGELDRNVEEQNRKIVEFCRDADLVSWDSQYTPEEYRSKIGWGHSCYESTMALAREAAIKHMVFTHHDPARTDSQLADYETKYRDLARRQGFRLDSAREGLTIEV